MDIDDQKPKSLSTVGQAHLRKPNHCGVGSCDKTPLHDGIHRCRCGKPVGEPPNGCKWHQAPTILHLDRIKTETAGHLRFTPEQLEDLRTVLDNFGRHGITSDMTTAAERLADVLFLASEPAGEDANARWELIREYLFDFAAEILDEANTRTLDSITSKFASAISVGLASPRVVPAEEATKS